ncbi:hypothetical protein L6R52_02375 [Myxococcota bacterium]|nr:hypothetical protein [Myxococcota bacterium]
MITAATAALLGVLELGARGLAADAPSAVDHALAADALRDQPDARALFEELYSGRIRHRFEPFVHYHLRPYDGVHVHVGPEGRRATPQPDVPADAPVVWVFGGSTIFGMGARDGHTIPAQLARAMTVPARIENYGQIGFFSTQELVTLLRELHAGRRPDVAIFVDGVNEVLPALVMGRPGTPLDTPQLEAELDALRGGGSAAVLGHVLRGLAPRSALLARLVSTPGPAPIESRVPAADEDDVARTIATTYRVNRDVIRALAARFGFEVVFFWQPTIFSKRARSPGEERLAGESRAYASLYAKAHRAVVGADGDAPIDLTDVFGDDATPVFFDFCHVSERGNQRLAERLAPHVDAALGAR